MVERKHHLDEALAPMERARALLAQMTLDEKIGQMCQYVAEPERAVAANVDDEAGYRLDIGEISELILAGRVGSFLKVPGARVAAQLQAFAAQARLAIPLLIATDAIHGHAMDVEAATVFPTPIGMAAAFDPALVERIAAATAHEMRETGFHWTFSPNLDVARDPRWGRCGETFGEDPFLVGELGAAMVRGYQGEELAGREHVLACAKHLVAGGISENGLNGAPAEVSQRTLREVFLPPFARAVGVGVRTLMPAHNEVNGIPCHADARLLTTLLRDEWGFRGFVVSDWNDIEKLHSVHRVAASRRDADRLAVEAGIDMHMHGAVFFDNVKSLVEDGTIALARIDAAATRILEAKFALGLFEERPSPRSPVHALRSPLHRELALEAARKSLVLLKNEGDLLPLTKQASLLVSGPNADDQSCLGDWARQQPSENVVTPLAGVRAAAPPGVRVEHAPIRAITDIDDAQIQAAVALAHGCDVTLVVCGENSLRDNPQRTSGENVDRASLELPGRQLELVQALVGTGRPVIVVLINGGALACEWVVEHVAALIEAWEPGMLGGTAIGEVLFGRYSPSGRLPVSVPRSVGHVRTSYDQRPSATHRGRFRFSSSEPLFPFGYGLGYATIVYRELRAEGSIRSGQALPIEIELENLSEFAAEEVVLVFVEDVYASVTRPCRQLKAFRRVPILAHERKVITFVLEPEAFVFLDASFHPTIESGEFRISVGQGALTKSVWLS